jgi:hypothetical protein
MHEPRRLLTSGDSLSLNSETSMATACMQQRGNIHQRHCPAMLCPSPARAVGKAGELNSVRTVGMFILLSCMPTAKNPKFQYTVLEQ